MSKWIAAQYLDDERWGVVNTNNEILVGAASRLTEANARLIADAVNAYNDSTTTDAASTCRE